MLKRHLLIWSIFLGLLAAMLPSCKNQCDSCPGIVKQKRVRKSSKGSI